MTAAQFQNAIRIMHSLDEVSEVLERDDVGDFHRNPMQASLHMDEPTWARVYALIEKRMGE